VTPSLTCRWCGQLATHVHFVPWIEEPDRIELVCDRCDRDNDDAEWFTLHELAAAPAAWLRTLDRPYAPAPPGLKRWLTDRVPARTPATPAASEPAAAWLTPEQVAERVGVSRRTVYRALTSGRLDGSKPTGAGPWRVAPADVDRWVVAGRLTSGSAIRPLARDTAGRPPVNPDLTWNL